MKFTDGNWMVRAGVRTYRPAQAYEVRSDAGSVDVLATTQIIHFRGNTLEGPTLAVRLWSPIEGVIGVKLDHWTGLEEHGPSFELLPGQQSDSAPTVEIDASAHDATLTSGALSAHVGGEKHWNLEFRAGGKLVTASGPRSMGLMQVEGAGPFLRDQLALAPGELVYGFGERFTAFVKNGQSVETWNLDGGANSEQAYKSIPFYMTNRGYGVFVNHPGHVSYEVATEKVSHVQFSVPGESLEYFVMYGPTPKEVLEKYTRLTGRPALPSAWSFGLWLTPSFLTDYNEATVDEFVQGMEGRDIPLHVFHLDCFWMREFRWCDFIWNTKLFPDPHGLLSRLKARGLHVCAWINPYIGQPSEKFAECKSKGYLIKKTSGDVWQTDQWQPGMGIYDFTNPEARAWYAGKLRELIDMGLDAFKTDFGERIPTEGVAYHDGSDPVKMHNYYTYLYNKTAFDTLTEAKGEAVLFARSATVGGQQFPAHWGGDCDSQFISMASTLRGGLSLGQSGFGFWSHDIGGFEGNPTEQVYKRWAAFGLLTSHSRLHGSVSYRVPWLYPGESATDTLRFFTKLKCRLMPYLFAKAIESHEIGAPMLRAMMLEFPDDRACDTLDMQYMLGDKLLVAPIFSEDDRVDYYVPAGRWTNLLSGEIVTGPGWRRERHDFLSLPLLVRPNTVLPVGAIDNRPDYDYADGVTFEVYELEESLTATASVPTTVGDTAMVVNVSRTPSNLTVQLVEGDGVNWKVLLIGINQVRSVESGAIEAAERGTLITPLSSSSAIMVNL